MRYGAESKLKPEEVAHRAREFFGPDGDLGLPEVPSTADSVSFGSESGNVTVTIEPRKDHTEVTVLSREYDSWAEQFIRNLS